jgi:hypothetical protein
VTRTGWIRALALWAPIGALVVLASRSLVYALAPRPSVLSLQLEQSAGGPRLVVIALVALGLGVAAAAALVWLAAIAVQERHALAGVSYPAPRPRLVRLLVHAAVLWVATCLTFALVESTIHWREGLGFHGLHCLTGPVHRDAIPILAALSLLAAAAVTAARHVLAWLRRVLPILLAAIPARNAPPLSPPPAFAFSPRAARTGTHGRPRAPPCLSW